MIRIASMAGLRVLVVEDDTLIAVQIEEILQDVGCVVIGPVGKLDTAMRIVQDAVVDVAILDVNIRGGHVFPVAQQLRARGVPFALASGYGDWALPEEFRNQPRLIKPFTAYELKAQVHHLHRIQGIAERAGSLPV